MCQLATCWPSRFMHKLIVTSLAIVSCLLEHIIYIVAREEGIEPSLTVLETAFLPLKDSRKSVPTTQEQWELLSSSKRFPLEISPRKLLLSDQNLPYDHLHG